MSLGRDVPSLPTLDKLVSEVADIDGRVDRRRRARVMPDSPVSSWPLVDPRCFLPVLFCSHFPVTPFLPALPGRFFIPSLPPRRRRRRNRWCNIAGRNCVSSAREGGGQRADGRTRTAAERTRRTDGRRRGGQRASKRLGSLAGEKNPESERSE